MDHNTRECVALETASHPRGEDVAAIRSETAHADDHGESVSVGLHLSGLRELDSYIEHAVTGVPGLEILVVDDDRSLVEQLTITLTKRGFRVSGCTSPEKALGRIREDPSIRVVVSDLNMGAGMDGLQLLAEIKSLSPGVEVIIMTAFGTLESAMVAIRNHAFDFILKPIEIDTLAAAIWRAVRQIEADGTIAHLSGTLFLSYARDDAAEVSNLSEKLVRAGYRTWLDTKDLLPGSDWKTSIDRAIRGASFFVACMSPRSVGRRGMLQREMRTALELYEQMLEEDIYILPLRMTPCDVPEPLKRFHCIDYFDQSGWARLVSAIHEGLRRRRP